MGSRNQPYRKGRQRQLKCSACGKSKVSVGSNLKRGDRRCDECRENNRPALSPVAKAPSRPRKPLPARPKRPRPKIPLPPDLETMRRAMEPYAAAVDRELIKLRKQDKPRGGKNRD